MPKQLFLSILKYASTTFLIRAQKKKKGQNGVMPMQTWSDSHRRIKISYTHIYALNLEYFETFL